MLQQGQFVADVAYFYGEEKTPTELFGDRLNSDVPDGYRYDYINPEALFTLLSVTDGKLTTSGGMQYRLLFLPPHVDRLSLPAMRKIRDLVEAGSILVARKPRGGLGRASSDVEILRIADAMWGSDETEGKSFGKGRIYTDIETALARERIAPDVSFAGRTAGGEILALHRRTADEDIYFVSNQRPRTETVEARFRVTEKVPQLWRAETGKVEAVNYRQEARSTAVRMRLAPHEAVFVVFSRASAAVPLTVAPEMRLIGTIDGPWTLSFQSKRGAPAKTEFNRLVSWTEAADAGIKYFSGSATYAKVVDAPAQWFETGRSVILDLGEVREIASVTVNGQAVGTVWHPPYRADITSALKPGKNRLAVRVVNLWPNRLIGDQQPGATPIAFAPQARYKASDTLLPSGLLGPVRLYLSRTSARAEEPAQ